MTPTPRRQARDAFTRRLLEVAHQDADGATSLLELLGGAQSFMPYMGSQGQSTEE